MPTNPSPPSQRRHPPLLPPSLSSTNATTTTTSSSSSSSSPTESSLSSLIHWFQLKKYQYEVTFSLYMLTATEKFIFNLVLIVFISMLVAAASMYLPSHVTLMYRRIWYYVQGEGVGGAGKWGDGDVVKSGRVGGFATTGLGREL